MLKLILRNGQVRHIGRAPRDRSASQAAKARRYQASQKKPTNIGNPNEKGTGGQKAGCFDPKSKSHKRAVRKQMRK